MEIKNFGYSAKQSAVASLSIISSPIESEQGFQDFLVNNIFAPCPSCGSTQINLVRMPAGCKHYFGQFVKASVKAALLASQEVS